MGKVIVYTDGAAKNNNESLSMEEKCRYCGWAYKITDKQENKCDIQSGGEQNKTNNQMELLAVIYAMRAIEDKSAQVEIYTDSRYVSENYKNASGMSSNQLYWQMFEEENEKISNINILWRSRDDSAIREVDCLAQKEAGKMKEISEKQGNH